MLKININCIFNCEIFRDRNIPITVDPLNVVLLSKVSFTCRQPCPQNIKLKIPETIHEF